MHGAPIFAGLAAERSGVDLVYMAVPACNETVTKIASLNFQVLALHENNLCTCEKVITGLINLIIKADVAVIGPGIFPAVKSIEAIRLLLKEADCALVLDAGALQPGILPFLNKKTAVLTPHRRELKRMGIEEEKLPFYAKEHGVTFFLKGEKDVITNTTGKQTEITGGNAGLTVGGTGDVLAGLIAGLIAQKTDPAEACLIAGKIIKRAGAILYQQKGYAYTAEDVIGEIPGLLRIN